MADGEYVHGTMDIDEHRKTFALFWTITKWSSILIGISLVFLAVTRTSSYDCSKAEVAAAHINACGKLPQAEGAGEHSE
jgi:hypothetical protein